MSKLDLGPVKKFLTYGELRANILDKMRADGKAMQDCRLVNTALELIRVHLPRSHGAPENALDDLIRLEEEIVGTHGEFCKRPSNHGDYSIDILS